jgi:hypothetical protein
MTTIATDGKSMAADSRGCCNDVIRCDTEIKIYRLVDGRIAGCSGTITAARDYVRWLNEGGEKPNVDKENGFHALVLSLDGTAQIHGNDDLPDNVDIPAAIGSGSSLALGAMLAGAGPTDAVAIAMKRDPFTGGAIVEMKL